MTSTTIRTVDDQGRTLQALANAASFNPAKQTEETELLIINEDDNPIVNTQDEAKNAGKRRRIEPPAKETTAKTVQFTQANAPFPKLRTPLDQHQMQKIHLLFAGFAEQSLAITLDDLIDACVLLPHQMRDQFLSMHPNLIFAFAKGKGGPDSLDRDALIARKILFVQNHYLAPYEKLKSLLQNEFRESGAYQTLKPIYFFKFIEYHNSLPEEPKEIRVNFKKLKPTAVALFMRIKLPLHTKIQILNGTGAFERSNV